mmetsp:Transcript_13952/g.28580  ORF Transcript_13952/g.28580 Transcript_13952/m.28580 type:complete len:82 (+) Transcript_13952:102-347(+)
MPPKGGKADKNAAAASAQASAKASKGAKKKKWSKGKVRAGGNTAADVGYWFLTNDLFLSSMCSILIYFSRSFWLNIGQGEG